MLSILHKSRAATQCVLYKMDSNTRPVIFLCPHCLAPFDIQGCYRIDPFPPAQPIPPPGIRTDLGPVNHLPASNAAARDSPPPEYQWTNTLTPPSQVCTCNEAPTRKQGRDESCRSSASSSSSLEYTFSDYSVDTEFGVAFQAVEDGYMSQQPLRGNSLPPPQPSQENSLPSTEPTLTLSTAPSSPHSPESLLVPPASGEPSSIARCWVVFRGRVPGVYTSS